MHVALHIPLCNSLKEKRSALKPCIHYLQDHFKLAVAEVGDHDIWRSAVLAAVAVSRDKVFIEQALGQAQKYLEGRPDVQVVDLKIEIL
jgi:hypothetical protein